MPMLATEGEARLMLDTDIHRAPAANTPRPSPLGDLRFAGTIAAGLVAGTLGLGALAAPLVGWKDWPKGLEKDASTQTLRLASPQAQPPRDGRSQTSHNGRQGSGAPTSPLTGTGL